MKINESETVRTGKIYAKIKEGTKNTPEWHWDSPDGDLLTEHEVSQVLNAKPEYSFPSSLVEPELRRKRKPRFPWGNLVLLLVLIAVFHYVVIPAAGL